MDISSAQSLLSYLNSISLFIQLVLLYYIYRNRSHLHGGGHTDHTLLQDVHLIDETREESDGILSAAVKQADDIIANAELKGIGLFAKNKLDSEKYSKEYHQQLEGFQQTMQNDLRSSIKQAEASYAQLMQMTNETVKQHLTENQKNLEQKTSELIDGTHHTLNSFISDLQETVKDQVNKELASARRYAEEYKQRKISTIDENVVELIEKTIAIVLGKTLFLKDQTDLVYKALEKAKNEHVFTS